MKLQNEIFSVYTFSESCGNRRDVSIYTVSNGTPAKLLRRHEVVGSQVRVDRRSKCRGALLDTVYNLRGS